METTGKVQVVARRWGCTPRQAPTSENGRIALKARGVIWCDEPGVGGGVLDRLREVGYAVEGFNGGHAPSAGQEQQAFLNLRAAAYWSLRRQLEPGTIALPADPLLWDELTPLRWRVNSAGQVQLEDKTELAQRLGAVPTAPTRSSWPSTAPPSGASPAGSLCSVGRDPRSTQRHLHALPARDPGAPPPHGFPAGYDRWRVS